MTMKHFYLTLASICLAALSAFAQHTATIVVTDNSTGLPVENASVTLDGNTHTTNAAGEAVFPELEDNTYPYSVSAVCHYESSGLINVFGADATSSIGLDPLTRNNLFFFIGDPLAITGSTVEVTDGADFFVSFVTSDPFGGEMIDDVPFGEYTYTITTPCYQTVSGTVTVDCNNGEGIMVMENPEPATRNNLFFFIGDPMAITGSTVEVTDGDQYNESFVTSDPFGGEMLPDVPFGEYSYTITTPCMETVTGTVTVDCNEGDGIAVIANPEPSTTNNLFFFIGDPIAILGVTVEVTDGADYYESFETNDPFGGEMLENVPFGEYSYTLTKPCMETVTGTVTVDCNEGDGIAVIANPAAATTNNLFFYIGDPMAIIGATVQVTNGADYDTTFVTFDTFGGELLADVPFGEISYTITTPCYETVMGTVTVDCNNGDGIAVFEDPEPANNLFFFIGEPLAIVGATVHVSNGADYDTTFVTSDTFGGEMLAGVPFGEISYTITTPCYETVSSMVTVDCNGGNGIAVNANPAPIDFDVSVTLVDHTLTAGAEGMHYQWVDCNDQNAPIDGATDQSYEVTTSGNYAVIVSDGDCSQTSICTAVIVTGLEELEGADAFSVYPVPFGDRLTVQTHGTVGPVRAELFSLSGQLLLDVTHSGIDINLPTAGLASGSYILRLTSDNARSTVKVVK